MRRHGPLHVCTAPAPAADLLSLVVLLWMHRSLLPPPPSRGPPAPPQQGARGERGDGALQLLKRPEVHHHPEPADQ